ncbi:hypothetical protein [Chitinophaga sp. Cy-1792]|uniref:hypothetical protein n=1 Tax=Chitinophaga sp. Cy-1792 TaxID=2608339 RepID=UPI001421FF92|nr:hypothetical protein [Chitinophaga sp. Cy-1792]NIG54742.1 hypothetical protein [Chitinophaga sp. Cy-1792]
MNDRIYIITHTNPALKTLGDFVKAPESPAAAYRNDIEAFGKVLNDQGVSNTSAIIAAHLLDEDRKKEQEKVDNKRFEELILLPYTKVAVEVAKIDRCALMTEGIEIVSNDITMFKADKLAELESDDGYKRAVDLDTVDNMNWLGQAMQRYPGATVWIWTKALSDFDSETKNGKIFDLTPYIIRLSTSVTRSGGGRFQLSLAPIRCEMVNNAWVLRTADRKDFDLSGNNGQQQFFANSNMFKVNGAVGSDGSRALTRSTFLFNNIITPNDVVFIRLETLEMEKDQREKDQMADIISKKNLPGRIYDMIGLVDKTNISINGGNNDVSIDVTGRDLSKLIYDDGTYFFPNEFANGKQAMPGTAANDDPLMARVNSKQALPLLGTYHFRTPENIIQFIIQQLSTIKIVPDDLFSAYKEKGERLNTRFNPVPANVDFNEQLRGKLNVHKKIVIDRFKSIRRQQGLAYDDPGVETKKLEEAFSEVVRYFKHIREKKVRKVTGNKTTGWKKNIYVKKGGGNEEVPEDRLPSYLVTDVYAFINHEDPTMKSFYADVWMPEVDAYIDLESSQPAYKPEVIETAARGIWQIVKLVTDDGIRNRILIDSSLSTASGSLINFFRKVCQHPFLEFQMDTYGDMFYIMLRKPPFDRKSILSALKGSSRTEKTKGGADGESTTTTFRKPVVVTIETTQVLAESLEFSDAEAVSWYQLIPRSSPFGRSNAMAMSMIPALYFKEYAEYFGSRAMQLTHNYLPATFFNGGSETDMNVIESQAVFDLKHMIESTAYLPFTRQGTITILRDRRIKAGNFIRFEPTGEIFFVEGVQHNLVVTDTGVDATTSIQVSRGMVEQLIYGLPAEDIPGAADSGNTYVSYFNIIETISEKKYAELRGNKATEPVADTNKPAPAATAKTTAENDVKKETTSTSGRTGRRGELDSRNEISPGVLERYPEKQWPIIRDFIREINNTTDYWVIIIPDAGPRTYEDQVRLHNKNKKNARPGTSRHEKSAALDISLRHKITRAVISKSSSLSAWRASKVVQAGDRVGMQWTDGRGYGNFASSSGTPYYDPVHFQIKDTVLAALAKGETPKRSDPPKEVLNTEQSAPVEKNVSNIEDVFKYFKVNKPVFNYFLNRLQMNPLYQTLNSADMRVVGDDDATPFEVTAKRIKKQ